MSAGNGPGVSSAETGAVVQKTEVAPKQPTQAELRQEAIQKGLNQRTEVEAKQEAEALQKASRPPGTPKEGLQKLADGQLDLTSAEPTIGQPRIEPQNSPATGPDSGGGEARQPGQEPTVEAGSGEPPAGSSTEGSQTSGTMTPPEELQTGKTETDDKTAEAQEENRQVAKGVNDVMKNADEALTSENSQYRELKEKQQQISKDTPEWAENQRKIDEMQRQKAKTLSDENVSAASGDAKLSAIRVAAEIHAPEKGPVWNLVHGIGNWYEQQTDKKPIVEARVRAFKMMRYYWEKRGDPKFSKDEREAAWKSIRQDLKEYGILRMKKFLLKDWPLLSLGMLLLFWLGITYGLHKLSGGK